METPALFEEKSWLEQPLFVFWIVLILAVAVLLYVCSRGQQLVIRDPGAFQAVFLDNGQVYFGKLRSLNRDLWSLTDIYYLRAGTLQHGSRGGAFQGSVS